ncbi:MAG: PPOX class F420-dependent oxidoreductase [Gammaproteobacteria bacterium]
MDDAIRHARTISLITFRKDGTPVATPVTPAVVDGTLCTITVADSWKAKRLARNPKVRVAPCTLLGRVLGEYRDGTARVIAGSEAQDRVRAAYIARFGWLGRVSIIAGRLRRSDDERRVIEITF